MNYGQRLKQARTHARISQAQLARRLQLNPQSIQYLEDPKKLAAGSQYTASIARECGVDPVWLETGDGIMLPVYGVREPEASYSIPDDGRAIAESIMALRPELRAALRRIVGAMRGDASKTFEIAGGDLTLARPDKKRKRSA